MSMAFLSCTDFQTGLRQQGEDRARRVDEHWAAMAQDAEGRVPDHLPLWAIRLALSLITCLS